MTDLIERMREAWAVASARPSKPMVVRALSLEGCEGIWAIITPEGRRGLIAEASAHESPTHEPQDEPMSVGTITVSWYPFVWEGRSVRALCVVCESDSLLDSFVGFAETFIRKYSRDRDVGTLLLQCVREFRELLSGGPAPITNSAIGLLGELIVLASILDEWQDGWRAWGRPEAERHDFRNNLVAVEVKTCLRSRRANTEVTISSVDQLQAPPNGVLFLWWIRLEHDQGGDISFTSILARVEPRLPTERAAKLREQVREVLGSDELLSTQYSLQDSLTFAVTEEFPAIVPARFVTGRVDSGINDLSYSVDLSTVGSFVVSEAVVIDRLREGLPRC